MVNKGNTESALSDFTEAISLNPCNAIAYHYRGIVHYRKNQYDDALNDLNKAIDELGLTDNADAYHHRGIIHYLKNQYNDALNDLNKAIDELGLTDNAVTYYYRGMANYKKGQNDAALSDFCKYLTFLEPTLSERRAVEQLITNMGKRCT